MRGKICDIMEEIVGPEHVNLTHCILVNLGGKISFRIKVQGKAMLPPREDSFGTM